MNVKPFKDFFQQLPFIYLFIFLFIHLFVYLIIYLFIYSLHTLNYFSFIISNIIIPNI